MQMAESLPDGMSLRCWTARGSGTAGSVESCFRIQLLWIHSNSLHNCHSRIIISRVRKGSSGAEAKRGSARPRSWIHIDALKNKQFSPTISKAHKGPRERGRTQPRKASASFDPFLTVETLRLESSILK